MKNIERIIKKAGHENDDVFSIRIENGSYMALCIEGIGRSPDGRKLISVAHYGEQNGDAMRDPDIVFLVDPALKGLTHGYKDAWFPVSYRNDYMGKLDEAMIWDADGNLRTSRRMMKSIKSFSNTWNRNIAAQGFIEAARKGTDPEPERPDHCEDENGKAIECAEHGHELTETELPPAHKCGTCGAANKIVNACGCDPNNLPTKPAAELPPAPAPGDGEIVKRGKDTTGTPVIVVKDANEFLHVLKGSAAIDALLANG